MSEFQDFIEAAGGMPLGELADRRKWELLAACAAVMGEAALSDKLYDADEYECMLGILSEQVGLQRDEAQKLLGFGAMLRQEKTAAACVALVNRHFDAPGRQLLYALIWKVIKADGRVDPGELEAATALGRRLGLTVEQEIEARRMLIEERI